MAGVELKALPGDLQILRELAARQTEIAHSEVNCERRRRWFAHNAVQPGEPMVLAEIGGIYQSQEWTLAPELRCTEEWARGIEHGLRWTIYHHTEIGDDAVVEPWLNVGWQVATTGYGVHVERTTGTRDGHMGSFRWEPPIKDLDRDLEKLTPRTFTVDREATLSRRDQLTALLGDEIGVRIRGGYWWTMGLTNPLIDLIGLDTLMLAMHDNPKGLHAIMAFLRDDHLAYADALEAEGLLTLNNENDYIGSGSAGHTTELPAPGQEPGEPARLRDLWVLSESQETVGVGPSMFDEFVFTYQQPIIERFGLCYYGCCEPVHSRAHVLRRIPNLRKLSVSPWCNEAKMRELFGADCVLCRKPNPALVSTPVFDESAIRADLRASLDAMRGCCVELVMKDVHTVCGDMGRLRRWVEIAREEAARA